MPENLTNYSTRPLAIPCLPRRKSRGQAVTDQAAIARRLLANTRGRGWGVAPAYIKQITRISCYRRRTDRLILLDDNFILHGDLRRLVPFLDRATSVVGKQRAELLRRTPQALDSAPPSRLALFSVTEALGDYGESMRQLPAASPYRGVWAHVRQSADLATLVGHSGTVTSVCAFQAGGRDLVASGGDDETVRVWDVLSGEAVSVLRGHTGAVTSVTAVQAGGRDLVVSGGDDGTVRVWDAVDGEAVTLLEAHGFGVTSVCAFQAGGRDLVASGGTTRRSVSGMFSAVRRSVSCGVTLVSNS